jgi:prophage regulatory protein
MAQQIIDTPEIESEEIWKLSIVKSKSGLSGTSIYRMANTGKFPKPIKLGERASGWLKSEVIQWRNSRVSASRTEEAEK